MISRGKSGVSIYHSEPTEAGAIAPVSTDRHRDPASSDGDTNSGQKKTAGPGPVTGWNRRLN